jgi:hypothetical protein
MHKRQTLKTLIEHGADLPHKRGGAHCGQHEIDQEDPPKYTLAPPGHP